MNALSTRPPFSPEESAKARVGASAALWYWTEETLRKLPSPAPMDATDAKLYLDAIKPLAECIRDGRLKARFERQEDKSLLYLGGDGMVWEAVYFLRNAEFRPKPATLAAEVRRILKIANPQTGADAEAARPVVAPPRSVADIIPSVDIDPAAPWVMEFAERLGTEDMELNEALLRVLGHVSSDAARSRVMDSIEASRSVVAYSAGESAAQRTERRTARDDRQASSRRTAEMVVRLAAEKRVQAEKG